MRQKQTFHSEVASALKPPILRRLYDAEENKGQLCAERWPSMVPAGVDSVPQDGD